VLPAKDESLIAQLRSLIAARRGFSVEFEEPALPDAAGALGFERDLSADLQPGSYSLIVTVVNRRTNQSAASETNVVVLPR
jgi:hypothetical protein